MTNTTKLTSLEQLKQLNFKAPPALSTKVEGKTPRKKREHQRAEPVYVRKLSEKMTQRQVGELIGVADATICFGLRDNEIAKPFEVAAKGIWCERYEPKPLGERAPLSSTERLVVLRLSTNDLKVMEGWLAENKVSFAVLT